MKMNSANILRLLTLAGTAGLFAAGTALHAQTGDATLDLLVSKGLISAGEAANIVKEKNQKATARAIEAGKKTTTQFTVSGLVQAQYQFSSVSGHTTNAAGTRTGDSPANNNNFELRRAQIDFGAKIGSDWEAFISIVAEDGASARDFLDKAGIAYKCDFGKLTGGFQKVHFGFEEYTSSTKLLAMERSIASNYFSGGVKPGSAGSRLGFDSRHVGLFWDGKIPGADGLEYGVAVTNGYQNSVSNATPRNNQLNLWAYAQYTAKLDKDAQIQAGINFGWQPGDDAFVVASAPDSEIIGYNPFVCATFSGATVQAEFLGAFVKNGAGDGSDSAPWGATLTAAYRFGNIEPVVRYSYLQGDGRGFKNKDVWRNSADTGRIYDEAWSIFIGANYYLMNDALRLSLGYEHARFSGSPDGNKGLKSTASGDGVRAQVQAVF